MTARHLQAGDSHLYPGARLGGRSVPDWAHWQAGDAVVVEFADLTVGEGRLAVGPPGGWLLHLAARSTAKGAAIAAQTWWLDPHPHPLGPGLLRVRRPPA
ncbi:hypothetical protein [Acidovorax sp.]|uniref:hypothetical protein n=1 Tax=Acidovorax sp. TaxID=1872122 RepID=UPI002ACD851F|nr:hypothetical protein [Acidovorax sp.]MDZ7863263.1 hypothetical protein [Acidovorax sp.]